MIINIKKPEANVTPMQTKQNKKAKSFLQDSTPCIPKKEGNEKGKEETKKETEKERLLPALRMQSAARQQPINLLCTCSSTPQLTAHRSGSYQLAQSQLVPRAPLLPSSYKSPPPLILNLRPPLQCSNRSIAGHNNHKCGPDQARMYPGHRPMVHQEHCQTEHGKAKRSK